MPADRPATRAAAFAFSVLAAAALQLPSPAAAASVRVPGTTGVFGDFLTGRFATAQADPDAAADASLRALEGSRNDPELLRQAFLASALAGRADAVGLARLLPGDRFAALVLTDDAVRVGDWSGVESRAHSLPHDPLSDVLRPLLVAWAEQAQGRTDAALATLQSAIEASQFRALFSLHAAMIADLAGQDRVAAQMYAQAGAAFGASSLRLAQALASFEARHGREGEAMGALARAAEAAPELGLVLPALSGDIRRAPVGSPVAGIAEAYLAAAGSLQQQSQDQAATLLLRFALELRPDFTPARLLLSDLLAVDHRPAAALATLKAIPAADPLAPLAVLRLAELARARGDNADAMAMLDRLAQECPQSPLPLARKAEIQRAGSHFAEAVASYNAAIARLPAQPGASAWTLFYGRGVSRDLGGDWPGAQADLQHALALSPDQAPALNYLGYSWADRNIRLGDARRLLDKAAGLDPNDGAIVDSLGWVMLRQGDVAGAVRTLERASELEPADPTINGHLGDAYAAAGRKLEAGYQWRRALALHPEPAEAERLRAKLDEGPRQSAVVETGHAGE